MRHDSRLSMDTTTEHELLKPALRNTEENPPISVFKYPFEQPDPLQVNACLHWLEMASELQGILLQKQWGEKGEIERKKFYNLKHLVEEAAGRYITTNAFACAALTANECSWLFNNLEFHLPPKKDVENWRMLITVPTDHMLAHLSGRNVTQDASRLRMEWDTSGSATIE